MLRYATCTAIALFVLPFALFAHDIHDDEFCVTIPEMDEELMQVVGIRLDVVAPDVILDEDAIDLSVSLQCGLPSTDLGDLDTILESILGSGVGSNSGADVEPDIGSILGSDVESDVGSISVSDLLEGIEDDEETKAALEEHDLAMEKHEEIDWESIGNVDIPDVNVDSCPDWLAQLCWMEEIAGTMSETKRNGVCAPCADSPYNQ